MKSHSKLVYELKELVEDYLKKYPAITIHGFSKKCGLAASTLRRILHLETREDPIPSTVLGIVSAISKESRIQYLIDMYDGEIRESLKRSYAQMSKFSYHPELGEVLSNREAYIIYKLAANDSGTTRQNIIDLLGIPAEEKIDELLLNELLSEQNGRLHAKEKNFILPEEVSKGHVQELLRFTYGSSQFVDHTIFKNLSESINKATYDKVWEILATASNQIGQLITKKENVGEIPFFFTCILDTMEVSKTEDRGEFGQ